jgi:hypothetical protein
MGDAMNPTFLTVAPDGTVTYDFSGHVHATLGFDIDAGTSSTPSDSSRLRWLRTSDGALVADLYAYNLPAAGSGNSGLVLDASDPDALGSFVRLQARPGGAGQRIAQLLVYQEPDDTATLIAFVRTAAGLFSNKIILRIDTSGTLTSDWRLASVPLVAADIAASANITRVLTRLSGLDAATNTLLEQPVFSYVVPANTMGTDKSLRLEIGGDWLHNSVAADTARLRVKFGGATLYSQSTSLGGTLSSIRHPWNLAFDLANIDGLTNTQFLRGAFLTEAAATAAPTTGAGNIDTTPRGGPIYGDSAIDTTVNQTLEVTIQWSAASVNNSWRRRSAALSLV